MHQDTDHAPCLQRLIANPVPQMQLSPHRLPDRSIEFHAIASCHAQENPVFKLPSWEEGDPLSDSALTRKITFEIYTYSCYSRGLDAMNAAYQLLDIVPKGRDEQDLPFPMTWVRRRDEY